MTEEKKMKKKIAVLIATIGILAGVLAGCGDNAETKNEVAKKVENEQAETVGEAQEENEFLGEGLNEAKVIRIGYQPTSADNVYSIDATHEWIEDEFKEDGIEVEWIPFNYGPPIIEALAAGELDFSTGIGNIPLINGYASGAPVQAISLTAVDLKSYGIVVSGDLKDEVKTVADLKGKKLALKGGSATEANVLRALQQAGVEEQDVEIVNIAATNDLYSAVLNHEVDAIGTVGPNVDAFTQRSDLFPLDISDSALNTSEGLNIVNTDFAEKNPEIVARFVKQIKIIQDYTEEHRDEVKSVIAENTDYSVEELVSVDRWTYKDKFDDEDKKAFEEAVEFLVNGGKLEKTIDVSNIFTNKYYEEAERLLEKE